MKEVSKVQNLIPDVMNRYTSIAKNNPIIANIPSVGWRHKIHGIDAPDGHAADELGQPLLQLLAIVVGGGVFDLGANLLHAAFDVGLLARALNDGGVVFVDDDAASLAQIMPDEWSAAIPEQSLPV